MPSAIVLNVIILNVLMLNIVMLNVVTECLETTNKPSMLNVLSLNDILLSVVLLNVVAPFAKGGWRGDRTLRILYVRLTAKILIFLARHKFSNLV